MRRNKPYKPRLDLVVRYTEGDCWALAGALHDLTGWQVVAVIPDTPDAIPPGKFASDWYHMAVRTPDGRILDIQGATSETAFLTRWRYSTAAWQYGTAPGRLVNVSPAAWKFESDGWNDAPVFGQGWASVRNTARKVLDTYLHFG